MNNQLLFHSGIGKRLQFIRVLRLSALLLLIASSVSFAAENETEIIFEANSGEKVSAFQGSFEVLENRNNIKSRKIPINYVRFPATSDHAGPPIVYLSGGPGGSGIGTAKRQRFKLFMAMRKFGDVIALDQRGTGALHTTPNCESSKIMPLDTATSDEAYFNIHRQAFRECLSFWKDQGIDILGYNTPQSVLDLDALRIHLGADKVTLWGISYGSHLALAALKLIENRIHKVIIASAEGLDQTIKMPFRTDAYFSRLQDAINQSSEAREQFPDIKKLMRRVHKSLEQKPIALSFEKNGRKIDFLMQRRDMQQLASGSISDPVNAWRLLQLYAALDAGYTVPLVQLLSRFVEPDRAITFPAMSYAMDLASGQSDSRYREVMRQAETAILASHLNSTIHYTGLIANIDLGNLFRRAPKSDVPLLLFSGTLDGRTYTESQHEAIAGLSNSTAITITNAGHNLFMSSPKVAQIIESFMRDEKIEISEIEIPLPF
jgi:pimeloyl-ACP methyl ester carboxylesterase